MTGERLGFYVINAQPAANAPFETLGNITPLDTRAPPWLIYTPAALQATLRPFTDAARSIEVADRAGWVIADLEPGNPAAATSDTFWLLRLVYRSILAERDLPEPPAAANPGRLADSELSDALAGRTAHFRYREPGSATRTILAASAPIRHRDDVLGAVVVRQNSEQYLSLTDQAFSRLLGYSLVAVGLGAVGMLGYASLLSLRIRQLNRAAHTAIGRDGAVTGDFPRSAAPDEIGELSRAYGDLLEKLREYNNYLRSLSRSLAHELRTPIAIIQTSLENLEQGSVETQATYLARARGGLRRLGSILTAMSEANQLEESIRSNPLQRVDLAALVQEMGAAYRGLYPDHPFAVSTPDQPAHALAAPELIAQALDKLVENAVSFSAVDPTIAIELSREGAVWRLAVTNQGPPLPTELSASLFDPMVSGRAHEDDDVHLGLGLHVARLICEYHGGSIEAVNVDEPAGVRVTLILPYGERES
jgi:signal transduction histidine kinase